VRGERNGEGGGGRAMPRIDDDELVGVAPAVDDMLVDWKECEDDIIGYDWGRETTEDEEDGFEMLPFPIEKVIVVSFVLYFPSVLLN